MWGLRGDVCLGMIPPIKHPEEGERVVCARPKKEKER